MTSKVLSILLLAVIVFAACANQGDDSNAVFPDAPKNPDQIKLVQMINELRANSVSCGSRQFSAAGNVVWNDTLAMVAKKHSEDMLANDKLSHTGTDGSFVNDRIKAAGYFYTFYAENLLKGSPSEKDAITAWKKSPAHCENMMDPNIKEIGVGTAGPYWTMVLASR